MKITIATCREIPTLDADDHTVFKALKELGADVSVQVWDNPAVEWDKQDACIIRSTWDSHLKMPAFREWAMHVSNLTTLHNTAPIVLWNSDKKYLRDLHGKGVPVVPTRWFGKGSPCDFEAVFEQIGKGGPVAIKPTVGAGSFGFMRADEYKVKEAALHLEGLLKVGDVMIQPYFESVQTLGEKSFIVIGGALTHAVRCEFKETSQRLPGWQGVTSVSPTDEETALVSKIIDALDEVPTYARVDVMYDDANKPYLSELELIEPRLYFEACPQAATRLAEFVFSQKLSKG